MFEFLTNLFHVSAIAEVNGIKFYSNRALHKYLEKQKLEKSRAGKHLYTFEIPWHQSSIVSEAKIALEEHGCFDYTVLHDFGDIIIKYWSPRIILRWKEDR